MGEQANQEETLRIQGSLLRGLFVIAIGLGIEQPEKQLEKWYQPGQNLSEQEFELAASRLHIKARKNVASDEIKKDLTKLSIPTLLRLKDGRYVVLGRHTRQGKGVVFFPEKNEAMLIPLAELALLWTGQYYEFEKKFSFAELARKFNFSWFMPVIKHYKNLLAEAMVGSFFLQFFGLITPLMTQVIIDKVIVNNGLATLDVLGIVIIAAGLFQAVMSVLRTYVLTHTTNKIDVILGARLFRQILSLPLQYFENRRVGDILMRVGSMNSIRDFLTGAALTAILDGFFVVVFLVVMFFYSVPLTFISLAAIPVYLLQNIVVTPVYQKRLQEVWEASAISNSFLVEALTGIQTVKSMALEPQFRNRWEQLLARFVQRSFNNNVFNMILGSSGNVIERLASFAVLWYGGYLVIDGTLTLGQLIAFQMLATQANAPLLRLVGLWQTVQQTILSLERLGDILHTRPENVFPQQTVQPQPISGTIALEHVTFRYRPDCEPVMKDVTLTIPAGSKVGIVGRSGSGKSTLTKLVQRLYVPETGSIQIDGHNIFEMDPAWLRKQIGVVLQENYLFSGSVRENIAIAAPSASMEDIIRVAKIAGAHDFILELEEGYDTKVGERGASLSGGQRQRIAIARALLTNPKILIFDEATSALDYESERIIMENLAEIAAERTMIMIAHRLSSVRHCDILIVVEDGRVVESGSHEELLARQGSYYKLYLQQEG